MLSTNRSTLLLALLAVTPIALLAWLGTYLIRDAARSTDSAMKAILEERLAVADHQLVADLHALTVELDAVPSEAHEPARDAKQVASALAGHPWVVETWIVPPEGTVIPAVDKATMTPSPDARAVQRAGPLRHATRSLPSPITPGSGNEFFRVLAGSSAAPPEGSRLVIWQTFVKNENLKIAPGPGSASATGGSRSGWHVTDGDFIYWRALSDGSLSCARLDGGKLRDALFARLPTPGLPMYPGALTLTTASGIPLHSWGLRSAPQGGLAPAQRPCSPPFSQWLLRYNPAVTEFPKPYLFPILLGVGSGSVLVLTLAWMFFQENVRELRVAQQRVTFVNQISHELKTPLTNIQLYTEMAAQRLEGQDDAVTKRHLGVVEAETARLNRLVQNVLNYARQQRHQLAIHPRPMALDDVVARAVEHWRPLLESKGFTVDLQLAAPPAIHADADAIEQILGNLLSNVDKYAASGKWARIRTESGAQTARLIVEDHGPGIPPGKRSAIFEAFTRLRSDLDEGVSGTGIGLTIARELAELHGGRLDVCEDFRDGARFILTLPIAKKSP